MITITAKPEEHLKDLDREIAFDELDKKEQLEMIARLEEQMRTAAKNLEFEDAAALRDTVLELKTQIGQ